ncbi:MAG: molybdopterin cofactor-binding domain-containing protein [Acidobacteriota bacterium]
MSSEKDGKKKGPRAFHDPVVRGASGDGGAAANKAEGEISTGWHDVGGRGPGGQFNSIGKARRRVDGRAKATGLTQYADDLSRPRMLYCRLLRSPHPHAKVIKVDTAKAAHHPDVKLVLTGADFPVTYGILPVSMDEHPLARDLVRHVGDPVAAVIARSEDACEAAMRLIEVEYEVLETISNPVEALATDEPRIHDHGMWGNVHKAVSLQFGDLDEGFAEADQIFEHDFFFEGNTHMPLEQHSSLAELDRNGVLTLHSSTQTPHYVHKALTRALEMDSARIRVVACPNGGGFGGKSDPFNHELVVAKAALILGRPVKCTLNREEVFYCHRGRHPVQMRFKTGVKKDGTLTAVDLQTLLDGGAFGSYGVASTFYTGALQTVTYEIPRYAFRGCRTFTNKPACGPKRGHGTVQPRFGQEVQLDIIAHELGIDPADLRLQQVVPPDSLTANFLKVRSIGLKNCIEAVVEKSGWRDRHGKLPEGRGLGLACSSYLSGAGLPIYWNQLPHSGVQLKLDRSGHVVASCGAAEIGQGSDDVLANMVCEVLGIGADRVRVITGDTDLGPVDLGSYSSRVTLMMGNAAIQAAERARDMIATAVAKKLEVSKDRLAFADDRVFDVEDPETGLPFAEACIVAESFHGTLGTVGSYKPPPSPARFKGGGVGPSPTYSYSACVMETEVCPETGWVNVTDVWIAHDIGRVLNPVLARGQVEGGVYMGLGEAMMEEQVFRRLPNKYSKALVHRHPSLLEYKTPTFLEMPKVHTTFIEEPDGAGPFGAKEVGQGPLLPIMPALSNSIFDAVGVRVMQCPMSPQTVFKALQSKDKMVGPKPFPDVPWPEPTKVTPPWEGGDGRGESTKKSFVEKMDAEAGRGSETVASGGSNS